MKCDDYRAGVLAGLSTDEMRRHAQECEECRSLVAMLGGAADELHQPSQWELPAADLEDRIVAEIAGATGAETVAAATPAPRWNRWVWLGAAAVVIALALTGGARLASRPDWSADVPGTDAAPLASATVDGWNTDAGTRMVIHATGIDSAPDGFVYEMWLSEGEVHVSGGTFREIDGAEILVGVRRADYPRIWITLEAIDEDESPSPTTVLDTQRQG